MLSGFESRTALFPSLCSPSLLSSLSLLLVPPVSEQQLSSPSLSRTCKAISRICPDYFLTPWGVSLFALSHSYIEAREQAYLGLRVATPGPSLVGECSLHSFTPQLESLCARNIMRNYFHNWLSITNYKYRAPLFVNVQWSTLWTKVAITWL